MALAVACMGCAPARLVAPVRPVVADEAAARAGAGRTWLQLDSALRSGDVARALDLLAPSVVVVLPAGDSLQGRAAVARMLSERFPGVAAAALHMFSRRYDLCLDGAVESGTDLTVFVGRAASAETLQVKVRVLWHVAAGGAWRLARVDLGSRDADSSPTRATCPRLSEAIFAQRRVRVTVLPSVFGYHTQDERATAHNVLRRQGYATSNSPTTARFFSAAISGVAEESLLRGPSFVSVRARIRGEWWLDVLAGYGTSGWSTYGVQRLGGSRVRLDLQHGVTAALLAQYEWRGLRLGAGPVAFSGTWTGYEDRSAIFSGANLQAVRTTESSSGVSGLVELGFSQSVSDRLFVDVRAQQRIGAQIAFPSFGTVSGGASVGLNTLNLHTGVGIAF